MTHNSKHDYMFPSQAKTTDISEYFNSLDKGLYKVEEVKTTPLGHTQSIVVSP